MKTFIIIVAALALLLATAMQPGACYSSYTYAQPWGYYPAGTGPLLSSGGVGSYLGCPGCPGCPDGDATPANPGDPGCLAYGYR